VGWVDGFEGGELLAFGVDGWVVGGWMMEGGLEMAHMLVTHHTQVAPCVQ